MKVIIAGSRHLTFPTLVDEAIKCSLFDITEVVSGGARGVDALGELWAARNGIPVRLFPADWDKHGKAAGPIRNREMAAYADALIAIWDGKSLGTKNMIDEARKRGLRIHVHGHAPPSEKPATGTDPA